LTGASGPSHPWGGELALSEEIVTNVKAALAAIERDPTMRCSDAFSESVPSATRAPLQRNLGEEVTTA
jgi:hypothetical protein